MVEIYGFQRSGSHFLAATLKANFYRGIDTRRKVKAYGHYLDRQRPDDLWLDYGKLLAQDQHLPPRSRKNGERIYIYRDGRAVARSLWMSEHFKEPAWEDWSFSAFLHTTIGWRFSTALKTKALQTLPEHWMEMLEMWKGCEAFLVRYEDLVLHPVHTLCELARHFDLPLPMDLWVPDRLVGLSPSNGGIDGWCDLFSEEDLEFFHSIVPRNYWGLYNAR